MKRRKKLWIACAALAVVVVGLCAFPYFAQCKGSSGHWRAGHKKLSGLVLEYNQRTGHFPESYVEIERLLHPDPEFDYTDHCDTWPFERSRRGTLKGITMRLAPEQDVDGVKTYLVRFPRYLADLRLRVDSSKPMPSSPAGDKASPAGN